MKKTKMIACGVGLIKKYLLFMKLTIVLTCFCLLQGFSAVRGQKITLNVQNEEIAKVLNAPLSTVKSRLRRGLDMLQKKLSGSPLLREVRS